MHYNCGDILASLNNTTVVGGRIPDILSDTRQTPEQDLATALSSCGVEIWESVSTWTQSSVNEAIGCYGFRSELCVSGPNLGFLVDNAIFDIEPSASWQLLGTGKANSTRQYSAWAGCVNSEVIAYDGASGNTWHKWGVDF
jgi:hypothetical protein